MSVIIEARNLSKQYHDTKAVDDLSFTVNRGAVYGFLGQNGAGKSTTIRMLLSLIKPTSGNIQLLGLQLHEHRKKILQQVGAIIEKPDLYNYLTALQNLQLMARLSGIHTTEKQLLQQLEMVGIAARAHSKVKTFSQGMKQRLGIACALIHSPKLIILDEPTNGLDPQGIADVRNLILHLSREEGKTIFVSSHLLSEIEVIADAMLIIDKGKKVAEGKVSELLDPAQTLVTIETTDTTAALQALQGTQWQATTTDSGSLQLRLHRNDIPLLNQYLVQKGISVSGLVSRHSLEDYFLSLTTYNQHVAAYTN
jgi:ABC-type multidrug transport system ATPase subunit